MKEKACFSPWILLALVSLATCQDLQPFITEPRLTAVIPVNSTALTVVWTFANASIDRSDYIEIYVIFYEYYYGYNQTYASTNYTFINRANNITSLTRNFGLVNAYYYVCFSSNSTVKNTTIFLAILNRCVLTRTCLRSNRGCPGPVSALVISTSITSTSFQIAFLWPRELPFTPNSFFVQLIDNGQSATALSSTQNSTHTTYSYQFLGLQSRTTYTVNASFVYTLMFASPMTNVTILTVMTSQAGKFRCSKYFSWVIFFFQINRSR